MKMSLTLVGILEDISVKYQKKLLIVQGFACDEAIENEPGPKKNYHGAGKALDIGFEKEIIVEAFRYLETFPEISGLGLDLQNNYIHIDLREKEPVRWVYVKNCEVPLTDENRNDYGLGEPVVCATPLKSASLDLPIPV